MDKYEFRNLEKDPNVTGKYCLNVLDYLANLGKDDEKFFNEWNYILKVSKIGFIR